MLWHRMTNKKQSEASEKPNQTNLMLRHKSIFQEIQETLVRLRSKQKTKKH